MVYDVDAYAMAVRETAANICAIAADRKHGLEAYSHIADELGLVGQFKNDTTALAAHAWLAALAATRLRHHDPQADLEAELLIRQDGFTPGVGAKNN